MDDTALLQFFTQPVHLYHRQYEAIRAVIVESRSQKEVAEAYGYQYQSLRQLICNFRKSFDAERAATQSPFFEMFRWVDPLETKMTLQNR